mmetsp:Transcript_4932/g.14070  ORF Transcript_4932/g.14070 Transcript_4932/m.14070 type:complete len:200 (-) Transcript_4932:230-829(-)
MFASWHTVWIVTCRGLYCVEYCSFHGNVHRQQSHLSLLPGVGRIKHGMRPDGGRHCPVRSSHLSDGAPAFAAVRGGGPAEAGVLSVHKSGCGIYIHTAAQGAIGAAVGAAARRDVCLRQDQWGGIRRRTGAQGIRCQLPRSSGLFPWCGIFPRAFLGGVGPGCAWGQIDVQALCWCGCSWTFCAYDCFTAARFCCKESA